MLSMRKVWAVVLATAVVSLTTVALAIPHGRHSPPATEPTSTDGTSLSIGRPNNGRLMNGALLPESEWLRYRSGDERFRYGTDELVAAVEIAAKHVMDAVPGARLTIGDISLHRGGRFRPHRSHRCGRDIDIAYYMVDADGSPAYAPRFVRFANDGTSRDHEYDTHLDDARNWELVSSLLSTQITSVQYMFVSHAIEQRLLDQARRVGADEELIARAETVLDQPRAGGRHDDHLHLRVYCDPDDRPRCVDPPPYHAWRPPDREAPQLAVAF